MQGGFRTARRLAAALAVALALVPATALAAQPRPITVVLAPRSSAALAAYARAVSDPTSPLYRHYLTPAQFARRFGAGPAALARIRRQLRARGLIAGALAANHLAISAVPAPGASRHALARLARVAVGSLPGVQTVEGLRPATGPHPLLVRAPPRRSRLASRPHVLTGGPQPCPAARSAAGSAGAYTADQIASAYGLSDLYRKHDFGTGVTVAIYELEPVAASDLAAYQACYGTHVPIGYVHVDGGAGSGGGSGEAALDIENVLAYAPGAHVLVYQGPNSNSGSPGSGPYDLFSAIINQDRAQVVSVSWGECEAALGPANARAENTLFEQAAIQGQTIVSAAGDSGAQDCESSSSTPTPQPAVDDPASQPFVTGVGGTTLTSLGPRPSEQVWNDGGTPAAPLQPGAGGGGISSLWGMPPAQLTAAGALGVRSGGPNGPRCGRPGGWCREVPDVSADADPATGYEIFWNGSGSDPISPRGWQAIGGTSAASPVWAALMALADASRDCAGGEVGMALPALYRAAGSDYASVFNDVRSGNNDFTGTNSGQFAAAAGYDMASGLGTPNAGTLVPGLCRSALRLIPIASRRSARRSTIAPLPVEVSDVPGLGAVLRARGLPPGLRLVPARAEISGTPRRAGRYHVTITAYDRDGARARARFTWTIGNPARLLDVFATGLGGGRPTLVFSVAAGRRSPALKRLTVTVPSDLRLSSTRSVAITSGGRPAPATVSLARGRLTLSLHRAQSWIHVVLGPRSVGPGSSTRPGQLSVTAVGSDGSTSRLRAGIQRR